MKLDRFLRRDGNDTRTDLRARAPRDARRRTRRVATPVTPFEALERRALLAGQLDPTFGGGDGILLPHPLDQGVATAFVADARGGTIVAGYRVDEVRQPTDFALRRWNSDGSLDRTFGNDGLVVTDLGGADFIDSALVLPDGKIVVAGGTGNVNNPQLALARYLPDGTLDATFGDGGSVTASVTVPSTGHTHRVPAIARQSTGRLIVGVPGFTTFEAVAFTPDGTLDTTFSGDGVAEVDFGNSGASFLTGVAVRGDDKVILGGAISDGWTPDSLAVARLNADGTLDTTFDADGKVLHPIGNADSATNEVLLQGNRILVGLGRGITLMRLTESGAVDATFGDGGTAPLPPGGYARHYWGVAAAIQPDGKILHATAGIGGAVVRYTPDGQLDTSFGEGGAAPFSLPDHLPYLHARLADIVPRMDGDIVLGGTFITPGFGLTELTTARLNPDGSVDTDYGSHGYGMPDLAPGAIGSFRDVTPLPGGKFLAVGDSFTADGVRDFYLARVNRDGSFDTTFGNGDGKAFADFGPNDAANRVVTQPDGKFVVFGTALARFNADGSLDTTFGGDGVVIPSDRGDGLALQPDGKILTVEGDPLEGWTRVARYLPDGSLDTSFGNGGRVVFDDPIGSSPENQGLPYDGFIPLDVAWQATTGRIVVGGQTPGFGTITDFAAVRLLPTGQLDTSFANGLGMITTGNDIDFGGRIDVAPDGRIAMAGDEEDEGPRLVLFDNDGNWARAALLPWRGGTSDVSFTPDGKIVVVGDAEHLDPVSDLDEHDIHLVRLNEDLTVDDSFGGPTGVRTNVSPGHDDFSYGAAIAEDGDVVVAGASRDQPVLARYDGDVATPQVTRTFFGSTAWSKSFLRALDRSSGDDRFGFGIEPPADGATPSPAGVPPTLLPWINLDTVSVQFNRPVTVQQGDLHVRGVKVAEYGVKSFRYDDATRTATWTLDRRIEADKLLLRLDGVEEVGAFRSRVDVLPGDVTGDRRVLAGDYAEVKKRFFTSPEDPVASGMGRYSVLHDVDGSGAILAFDYAEVKKRFFTELPAGQPTDGGSGAGAQGVTRGFFSEQAVLA